jgi:superfamily II DNA or RNA helicase
MYQQKLFDYGKSFGFSNEKMDKCVDSISTRYSKPRDAIYQELVESLERNLDQSISSSKLKLKDYQEKAVRHMIHNRGLIISFEVGAGKTLTAVTIISCLQQQAEFFNKKIKVVIVTPTSLQENFKKEMRNYGVNPNSDQYAFYTIAGFANATKKGNIDCNNTLLIIDEGHNLRTDYRGTFASVSFGEKEGTRAETFIKCAHKAWKVVILTATPAYNRPYDIVNLVSMVKGTPPLTSTEWYELMINPEGFNKYFGCIFAFFVPPRDEYPDRIEKYVYIPMTPEVEKEYSNIEYTLSAKARRGKGKVRSRLSDEDRRDAFATLLRQASNNLTPCLKCEVITDILENGEKTIIYSEFKTSGIGILQSILDRKHIPFLSITGSTPKNIRANIVKEINEDKGPKILFITKAGGEGLDLKGIRQVILMEKGWNKSSEEQVIGRAVRFRSHIHLLKSEQNVTVYHIILVRPLDKAIIEGRIEVPKVYIPSVEYYLHVKAIKKKEENDALIRRLDAVSITSPYCEQLTAISSQQSQSERQGSSQPQQSIPQPKEQVLPQPQSLEQTGPKEKSYKIDVIETREGGSGIIRIQGNKIKVSKYKFQLLKDTGGNTFIRTIYTDTNGEHQKTISTYFDKLIVHQQGQPAIEYEPLELEDMVGSLIQKLKEMTLRDREYFFRNVMDLGDNIDNKTNPLKEIIERGDFRESNKNFLKKILAEYLQTLDRTEDKEFDEFLTGKIKMREMMYNTYIF